MRPGQGRLAAVFLAAVTSAQGQAPAVPAVPAPDCGSVVIIRCDRMAAASPERAKQDASRRIEARRAESASVELDRVIIEGEAERRITPEQLIGRVLARPLVRPGETSYSIGEAAQCTCLNICPPPPFPCCNCTDQPGRRLATSPGWKPTY
jgi:hypothetical protein